MGNKNSAAKREEKRKNCDIWIDYCGAWGHYTQFVQVKTSIEQEFNGAVSVDGADTGFIPSGEFKITHVQLSKVYHDKKGRKDGVVTKEKLAVIIKEISEDFQNVSKNSNETEETEKKVEENNGHEQQQEPTEKEVRLKEESSEQKAYYGKTPLLPVGQPWRWWRIMRDGEKNGEETENRK